MNTLDLHSLVWHIDDSPFLVRLQMTFVSDNLLVDIGGLVNNVKYFVFICGQPDNILVVVDILNDKHLIFAFDILFDD